MPVDQRSPTPLVSVVIPCFNQGRFLRDAIASVQTQTYPNIEMIVVDDGSADDTREVATSCQNVRYFYQDNAGLSAARNAGIDKSLGKFLVFLDADDVLYPHAVQDNFRMLAEHPRWAFVAGAHDKVDEWLCPLGDGEETRPVPGDHYKALLRGNFIGMHGAVMYRREVFHAFMFDTSLRACEDYDLYFRIARSHPIGCHAEKVAAYRRHNANMSGRYLFMLAQVLKVHGRQKSLLRDADERRAWNEGVDIWRSYYAALIYKERFNSITGDSRWPTFSEMRLMAQWMPSRFRDYVVKKLRHNFRQATKHVLPDRPLKWLHRAGWYIAYTPPPGKVESGDFNRVTPFSGDFGFDRGGAIDRFYIERFLDENRSRVRGRVLEIGDNAYTLQFGGNKVQQSDVLHIDAQNDRATYIGDITDVPQIPSNEFDCIIFTQTLHLIYDFTSALRTCYRILKPGGCLLMTVPGISHVDKGVWRDYWLWSFTDASVRRLLTDTFTACSIDVRTYGNVYVAAAFLYGMGLPECRRDFLLYRDPSYQVIVSAAAVKG